jgi:hypothetical protein
LLLTESSGVNKILRSQKLENPMITTKVPPFLPSFLFSLSLSLSLSRLSLSLLYICFYKGDPCSLVSDKVTARPRLVKNKPKNWNIEKSKRKKDMLQVAGAREGTITPPHPKSPGPTLRVSYIYTCCKHSVCNRNFY